MFAFGKKDTENLAKDEKDLYKKLAKSYLALSKKETQSLIKLKELFKLEAKEYAR